LLGLLKSLRPGDSRTYAPRRAAEAAGQSDWFVTCIAQLRKQHRRRPTLIATLDKTGPM
jgi:hypothetical protein